MAHLGQGFFPEVFEFLAFLGSRRFGAGADDGIVVAVIGGEFADHITDVVEVGAAHVADGGVKRAENEFAALQFDGAAEEALTTSMSETWMDSSSSRSAMELMRALQSMRWWK